MEKKEIFIYLRWILNVYLLTELEDSFLKNQRNKGVEIEKSTINVKYFNITF